MPNLLANETSPYLKQHAENPVQWHPWGKDALELARTSDKPIFLSVGYSACHWCHVMAHECFENPEIAQLMNQHFINIKVDREERPDLDQIYQPVAQILTRGGGWPLSVFLTPDLKPFYGGTYFPPDDRYGRPGFPKVLLALVKSYEQDRAKLNERAEKMAEAVRGIEDEWVPPVGESPGLSMNTLVMSARNLLNHVDWQNGGLGGAPKFPNTSALTFLWRMSLAKSDEIGAEDRKLFREAVLLSLEKIRRGGIFDQIGGGFHRYAVDATWSIPHFEKMLYDNALLLKLLGEVLATDSALTSDEKMLFLSGIEKTVTYLKREMLAPNRLFYSAQDADSVPAATPGAHAEEGAFFGWTMNEVDAALTVDEATIFKTVYGVTEAGNFENGQNVFFLSKIATKDELVILGRAEKKLFLARENRPKPALDDKFLNSWNALMISGLAWASLAFEMHEKTDAAIECKTLALAAYQKLIDLRQADGRVLATGQLNGYLDDYSFLAQSALDLARVYPEQADHLFKTSQDLALQVLKRFDASPHVGFFFTAKDHEQLIHRPKSLFDQAIPSGNGVTFGLMSLFKSNDPAEPFLKLDRDLPRLSAQLEANAYGMSEILSAGLLELMGPITLKGPFGERSDLKFRADPFAFVIDGQGKVFQKCQNQTCQDLKLN